MSQDVIELTIEISPRKSISKMLYGILPQGDDNRRAERIRRNLNEGKKLKQELVRVQGASHLEIEAHKQELIDGEETVIVTGPSPMAYQKTDEYLFDGSFLQDGCVVLSNGRVFIHRKYKLV